MAYCHGMRLKQQLGSENSGRTTERLVLIGDGPGTAGEAVLTLDAVLQ